MRLLTLDVCVCPLPEFETEQEGLFFQDNRETVFAVVFAAFHYQVDKIRA